jgi:hypothetical protein
MENRQGTRWHKRLEAIMRLDGERLTGFLSNISNEGMEIRTKARIQVNDEVSVRVLTPEGRRYNYLSEVRWWRPAYGQKMGRGVFRYGLRHMAVDPYHSELMEMIEYNPIRRHEPRFDAKVTVEVTSMTVHHHTVTENISANGAFLRIDELPPPYRDEHLTLSINLEENDKPIIATARVVHLTQPGWGEKLGLPTGIGLHFMEISDEARFKLSEFLKKQKEVLEIPNGEQTRDEPADGQGEPNRKGGPPE